MRESEIKLLIENQNKELKETKHALADATVQINGLSSINNELKKTMGDILEAIKGNRITKQKGIIDRLIELEEFMAWFQKKKALATGYALGISFMITIIGGVLYGIFKIIELIRSS